MHPCTDCNREFPSAYELQRHKNRKIPCTKEKYKCEGCLFGFTTQRSLTAHINEGRCKGKPAGLVAQELAEENLTLRNLLEKPGDSAQDNISGMAAGPDLLTEQSAEINPPVMRKQRLQLPVQTLAAIPTAEFVYAVWSEWNRAIKAGHWKGTLRALRRRYVSVLGKNMQIMLFQCQNGVLTERLMFEKLKLWHIESELYRKECLNVFPTVVLSLSSVSDAVQRTEQTSGGQLFSRLEIHDEDNSVLEIQEAESNTMLLSEKSIAPPTLSAAPASTSSESQLLRLRLEKLKVKRQRLEFQEQQMVVREQELVLEEQMLHC